MRLAALDTAARGHHLTTLGACHTVDTDGLGDGTIILLGPREPGFWQYVTGEPEFQDDRSDPLDRWSARVIAGLAVSLGAEALFPFGTPALPFIRWALRSKRSHTSPVGLLVHDEAGLMVSFRGALLFPGRLDLPETPENPCTTCDKKPCLSACPVGALTGDGYNLAKCHAFLDTPNGAACMSGGCLVRQSCPVSKSYGRRAEQSAYHMAQFHPR